MGIKHYPHKFLWNVLRWLKKYFRLHSFLLSKRQNLWKNTINEYVQNKKYLILATVKSKIQIRAGILAMYILSLPVILFFHSQTHRGNSITIVKSDFADLTTQDNSNCQICSFYFDQQLYVENSFVYQLDFSTYYFHQNIVETLFIVSQEQQYLRGPPSV